MTGFECPKCGTDLDSQDLCPNDGSAPQPASETEYDRCPCEEGCNNIAAEDGGLCPDCREEGCPSITGTVTYRPDPRKPVDHVF